MKIALGIVAVLAIAVVLYLESILAGLGFHAHVNMQWVEREIFLEAYGIEANAGRSAIAVRSLPGCFQAEPAVLASYTASSALCGAVKVARGPTDETGALLCDPLLIYDSARRELPFTAYRVETLVFAAGRGTAETLPATLASARQLDRSEFGARYSPGFQNATDKTRHPEMLVYDDAAPDITTADCGDHAVIGITFDPGSRRR